VAKICGLWIVAALFAAPSSLSKILCEENTFISTVTYYQHVIIFELLVSCLICVCLPSFTTASHLVESPLSVYEGTQNPLN